MNVQFEQAHTEFTDIPADEKTYLVISLENDQTQKAANSYLDKQKSTYYTTWSSCLRC